MPIARPPKYFPYSFPSSNIPGAGNFLFGAPSTQQQQPEDLPPPRQLGETAPEKSEIEVDDDGFATVPTRRQGKR